MKSSYEAFSIQWFERSQTKLFAIGYGKGN